MSKLSFIGNAADDPDAILEQAKDDYESLLILGWGKDGYLDVRSTTNLKANELLWLIEVFKCKLINGDYSEDT